MNINKVIQFSLLISVALLSFTACSDLFNFDEKLRESVIKLDCGTPSTEETPPLFVVNDEMIHQDSLKNLNPNYIRSISILKGQEAVNLFGSAGKSGVVHIHTDQKKFSAK